MFVYSINKNVPRTGDDLNLELTFAVNGQFKFNIGKSTTFVFEQRALINSNQFKHVICVIFAVRFIMITNKNSIIVLTQYY